MAVENKALLGSFRNFRPELFATPPFLWNARVIGRILHNERSWSVFRLSHLLQFL